SVKVLADRTGATPLGDDAECRPVTPYAKAKLEGERLARAGVSGSAPVAVLRLAPGYGDGSKGNLDRLVRITERRWMPLLPRSSGRRSMVHVDDVAALVAELVRAPRDLQMVVSDGERYSVREIQDRARAHSRPS